MLKFSISIIINIRKTFKPSLIIGECPDQILLGIQAFPQHLVIVIINVYPDQITAPASEININLPSKMA